MLADVCAYIHNYFPKKVNGCVVYYQRTYTISDGMLSLDFMKEGQRFLLSGSDLNDGVYTYHANGIMNDDENDNAYLQDEVFSGTICPMAVPKELIELCTEIGNWMEKYGEAANSPFIQETVVGVYSYMKATKSTDNGEGVRDWTDVFAPRLNKWRKACL